MVEDKPKQTSKLSQLVIETLGSMALQKLGVRTVGVLDERIIDGYNSVIADLRKDGGLGKELTKEVVELVTEGLFTDGLPKNQLVHTVNKRTKGFTRVEIVKEADRLVESSNFIKRGTKVYYIDADSVSRKLNVVENIK